MQSTMPINRAPVTPEGMRFMTASELTWEGAHYNHIVEFHKHHRDADDKFTSRSTHRSGRRHGDR